MSETYTENNAVELVLPDVKNWKLLLLISVLSVSIYQGIIHLSPYNMTWLTDGSFSWANLLSFLLIDQILIEIITVAIIILGIRWYSRFMNLQHINLDVKSLILFFIKYLPLFLLIYFCFSPLTTSIRYLLHYFPTYNMESYLKNYFFLNKNIYLAYLFPTFLIGYGLLGRSLFLGKTKENTLVEPQIFKKLLVKNQEGEKYITTNELALISREQRKYMVKTIDKKIYMTSLTLSSLEDLLPPHQFARINRAAILRLDLIDTFSYWENQKYILKTKLGDEFIISRERMKVIKEKISGRLA